MARQLASRLAFAGALMLALPLSGCGPATYNVRASRAFSNEPPDVAVVADRAADLDRALALSDELLLATPYSPGDPWLADLRLEDDRADAIRDRFADAPPYSGDYDVPLVKLYKTALEEALAKAKAIRGPGQAKFPSIFDALAALSPEAIGLGLRFRAIEEARRLVAQNQAEVKALAAAQPLGAPDPPELVAARTKAALSVQALLAAQQAFRAGIEACRNAPGENADDAQIARDALDATTFVVRMHLEALAVQPFVVKQAKRLGRSDPAQAELAAKAEVTGELLDEEKSALEPLSQALTVVAKRPLEDAAGYAMHETLLEQAARINIDATHVHIKGDAELLFFHEIASPNASGGANDYTGRTRRLSYSIDPVFMVGGRILAAYDFLNVKNAASLNAGFTTDRLFSSGGDIENQNSLGQLLGLSGLVSDFFDIGVDLLGVRTSVKVAKFTSGEVSEIDIDAQTGRDRAVVGKAPFQLEYNQVDIGFDVSTFAEELAEEYYVESFLVGFRTMGYSLPRVLYELRQATPGDDSLYVLDRQSAPQTVASRFYMGGFSARFGQGEWPRLSPFGDVGVYGGAGPVNYTIATPQDATMLGLTGTATLGLRLRLTPRRSRPRFVAELSYKADLIGQGVVTQIQEVRTEEGSTFTVGKKVDLGGFDLFHGPRLLLVVVF